MVPEKHNVELMSTAQTAEHLGITVQTVARWVTNGKLSPALKAPGQRGAYFFNADEIRVKAEASA